MGNANFEDRFSIAGCIGGADIVIGEIFNGGKVLKLPSFDTA